MMPLGRETIESLTRTALAKAGGAGLYAFIVARHRSVSRFANSTIHQALDEDNVRVEFRARLANGASVVCATHSLVPARLAAAARRAAQNRLAESGSRKEGSGYPKGASPLARRRGVAAGAALAAATTTRSRHEAIADEQGVSIATAASSHERRAEQLVAAFARAPAGLTFAGVFGAQAYEFAVVHLDGPTSYARTSKAVLNVYGIGRDGDEGYASAAHRDVDVIDVGEVVSTATDRAERATGSKRRLPAGGIAVVLAPDAVEELLEWTAMTGFGGKMFVEGASFTSGRLGQRLFDERVTVADWGLSDDPLALRFPFDCEGVPKRRLALVERGVARAVAHDHETAARAGSESTGHASNDDPDEGPLPRHLFLEPGNATTEELIARVDFGLWVTKLHYVNGLVNTREGAVTGLTRGGTFLIERGKLGAPVETMRFSDRIPAIFSQVGAIGREVRLVPSWIHDAAGAVVPPVLVSSLNFL